MSTNKPRKTQVDRFIEVSRDLGADEDPEHFKAKLRKIANADVPEEDRKKPKRASD